MVGELRGHKEVVTSCQIASLHGDPILITGSKDKSIKIWNLVKNACSYTLNGHSKTVLSLKMAGNRLISGGSDNCVKIWDLATLRCIFSRKMDAHVIGLDVWDRMPETIFIQLSNGSVSKWSPETNDFSLIFTSSTVGGISIGVDGELYTGKSDGSIVVTEGSVKKTIKSFVGHSRPVERLRYYHPGFLVSSSKGEVKVWNVMNGTCVLTAEGDDFDLVETIESGATLLALQSKSIVSLNVQETIKALKVQNAILEANDAEEKEIFLAHCDLSSLPLELASHRSYQHITHLHINNNMLSRLGSGLAKLKALQVIQAQHNRIVTISSHLGKLSSLHTLLLGDNELAYLPGEIGRLEKLDLLDLSQNKLEYLPSSLAALRELTTLFLHDNCLGGADTDPKSANLSSNPTSPRQSPSDSSHPTFTFSSPDDQEDKTTRASSIPGLTSQSPSHQVHFAMPQSSRATEETDSIAYAHGGGIGSGSRLAASTSSLLSPRGSSATGGTSSPSLLHHMSAANATQKQHGNQFGPGGADSSKGASSTSNASLSASATLSSSGTLSLAQAHAQAGGITSETSKLQGSGLSSSQGALSSLSTSSSSALGSVGNVSATLGAVGIPAATSLANVPITSRNLSLRPTISSREGGHVRGFIYSAKDTAAAGTSSVAMNQGSGLSSASNRASPSVTTGGEANAYGGAVGGAVGGVGVQMVQTSVSQASLALPSSGSSATANKGKKSPRPLITTADSTFFAPNGLLKDGSGVSAATHASALIAMSHGPETPPSSGIITAPTTLPASSTPRAKASNRSVSSASASSTATNASSATNTTNTTTSQTASVAETGSTTSELPLSPRSPRRSPTATERKKTKLKKESTLPTPGSPSANSSTATFAPSASDPFASPSYAHLISPDSSVPTSPATSTRKKRGKSSRPLSKKRQSSGRRSHASPPSPTNGDDTAEEDNLKPATGASKKKASRKSVPKISSSGDAKSSGDPNLSPKLPQNTGVNGSVAEEAEYVSPALKNASVRKSMNRYSVMKVSAKWVEQAILDSMAQEGTGAQNTGSGEDSGINPLASSTTISPTAPSSPLAQSSSPQQSRAQTPDPEALNGEKDQISVSTIVASPGPVSDVSSAQRDDSMTSSHVKSSSGGSGMKLAIDRIPARQQSSLLPGSELPEVVSHQEVDGIQESPLGEGEGKNGNSKSESEVGSRKSASEWKMVDREEYLKEEVVKNQVYLEEVDFGQMRSLKLLHLQANRLETLPRSLGECRSLTDLDLAENKLGEFSEWLCDLNGLVRLSLACNEIRSLPEAFTKLTRLVELYMDENELEGLPVGVVKSFSSLRVFHCSHNNLSTLPHGFGKLPNLTELNLSYNSLCEFPSELTMLKSLIFLAIDSNDLKHIPTSLFFLPNLKSLEARDNQLTSVPYPSLIHLECLQLDNNLIQAITKDIASLHHILDLSFNGNPIREIPEEIGALSHLIRLDLGNLPIAQLPDSICLLPKLRKLILTGNTNMTWPSPSSVAQLETEALLESMVKSRFGSLKPNERHRLCFVGLQGSGKSSLFHMLKNAKPPKKNAIKPTKAALDVDSWSPKPSYWSSASSPPSSHSNANNSSPTTNSASSPSSGASANSNVASSPSFDGQSSPIPSNFAGTSQTTLSPSTSLLGVSGGGAQMDRFSTSPSSASLNIQKITFNVWDFSGNEDYRIMHQLYLSEGAVFVVVWNLALDESRSTIDYWLNSIRCHAGPLAPVIIAATHSDNFKNCEDHPTLRLLESKYLNSLKYPNVRGIIAVSAITGENVEKLGRKICHLSLELRRDLKVPASFHKVLASIPKDLPAIQIPAPIMDLTTMEKFLASKFGFDELTSAAALRYLHEVGAIINLQSIHFGKDLSGVIVNPEWFAKIYSEIFSQRAKFLSGNSGKANGTGKESGKSQGMLMGNREGTANGGNGNRMIVANSEGFLKHDELELIWKESGLPSLAHYTFIAVLHKLEMCFDDGNHLQMSSRNFYQNISTFPSFLSEQAPEDVPWKPLAAGEEEISLLLRLAFIPASLIPKLMSRVFSMLRPQSFWRYGFIVQSLPDVLQPNAEPEMSAFLEIQPIKNEIHVWIRGSHMYSCMNLMIAAILNTLSSYHYPPSTSIHRHLQCAFKTNKETQVEIVAITMHKVEFEISRGVTLLQLTTGHGHQVPLTHIHADIAEPITQFNTI